MVLCVILTPLLHQQKYMDFMGRCCGVPAASRVAPAVDAEADGVVLSESSDLTPDTTYEPAVATPSITTGRFDFSVDVNDKAPDSPTGTERDASMLRSTHPLAVPLERPPSFHHEAGPTGKKITGVNRVSSHVHPRKPGKHPVPEVEKLLTCRQRWVFFIVLCILGIRENVRY
jgi:hypothetical protein